MRIIEWESFTRGHSGGSPREPLSLTIGVFDGVHRGHQALIRRICVEPGLPTVVTFRQNPLNILKPLDFPPAIYNLEQKLAILEEFGVKQTILIDFSENFSKINGRDFIDLLLKDRQAGFLALGWNFRCGYGQGIGVQEISAQAAALGVTTWIAEPVLEGDSRISSSRIRQAIAAGNFDEASLLLGRPYKKA
jgi:riboflavin kinase/FMN adenylyltransferase